MDSSSAPSQSKEEKDLLTVPIIFNNAKYIFYGTLVIPTQNPFFLKENNDVNNNIDENNGVEWLGPGFLKLCHNHILVVNNDGKITHISHHHNDRSNLSSFLSDLIKNDDTNDLLQEKKNEMKVILLQTKSTYSTKFIKLGAYDFLCPGFIDLHIHAPQYAYTGTATDRPLMGQNGWLETYTFPAESSLKTNLQKARTVYDRVVNTTLRHGTTTATYYATLDLEPTKILVDKVLLKGQRALVGKVCMDRNSPSNYIQSTEQNIHETKLLIQYIHDKAGEYNRSQKKMLPLIMPIITPRFIPTCTPALLSSLGQLAKKYNCHIQSHISESIDEVEFTKSLDDNSDKTDTQIFDTYSLLSDRCIMAHGVYLSPNDLYIMRRRGAACAHCPLSNFFFAGGTLPCRKLMELQNKVGLGTDVAGGYSPSMLSSLRMAVVTSHVTQNNNNNNQLEKQKQKIKNNDNNADDDADNKASTKVAKEDDNKNANNTDANSILDYRHSFYLATLGGAEALGLEESIGTFKVGMEFDAIILTPSSNTIVDVFESSDTIADIFQKIINLGDDRNVQKVYVSGNEIDI